MNTTEFVQFNYKSKGFGYLESYGGDNHIQMVKGGKNVSYNEQKPSIYKNSYGNYEFEIDSSKL